MLKTMRPSIQNMALGVAMIASLSVGASNATLREFILGFDPAVAMLVAGTVIASLAALQLARSAAYAKQLQPVAIRTAQPNAQQRQLRR